MLVRTRFQTHLRPASTAPQPPAEKKDPSELTPDIRAALGACVARAAGGGG